MSGEISNFENSFGKLLFTLNVNKVNLLMTANQVQVHSLTLVREMQFFVQSLERKKIFIFLRERESLSQFYTRASLRTCQMR